MKDYEEWLKSDPLDGFKTIEDSLLCEFAESGADRELDFDLEEELEERYEQYLLGGNNETN